MLSGGPLASVNVIRSEVNGKIKLETGASSDGILGEDRIDEIVVAVGVEEIVPCKPRLSASLSMAKPTGPRSQAHGERRKRAVGQLTGHAMRGDNEG
jgi:hypothetical protein